MLLNKVKTYCTQVLEQIQIDSLPFHGIHHTKAVVSHVKEICRHLGIPKKDMEPIIIAAWFHDVGHASTYYEHEEESIKMAERFLKMQRMDMESIEIVTSCIRSTKMPQQPNSLQARILCDADLYHLGSKDYFYWQILLRREWEISIGEIYTDIEWYEMNHRFLAEHCFHSAFGKNVLATQLKSNLSRLEDILLILK